MHVREMKGRRMLADIEPRSRTVEEVNIYKGVYPLPDIHTEQH